ncbi:MAG: acetate--CoA ligase family protein [Desulfobacterales bacterium]|nr:acetate--CoA ligase family protein [Desulfobacterales bacterium]
MNDDNIAVKLIAQSLESNSNLILEDDAKTILKAFDINVVNEKEANTIEQACEKAIEIGFPVVLKGLASDSAHKSEKELVKVGLHDIAAVREAVSQILTNCTEGFKKFLVQPMVKGNREFVAGMFRDPQFGAVIMFGLGGIFTEALNDVVFRVAPIKESDVVSMIDDLISKKLLGDFRGEKAVDLENIKKVLFGLSRLVDKYPAIKEVDINPLIAQKDGTLIAVDALIITTKQDQKNEINLKDAKIKIDKKLLRSCFYPESIAFIGASSTLGKWGHFLTINTLSGGYKGDIFLVNPKGGTILGKEVYKSVLDIKEKVDLAVVTIPANKVVDLIDGLKQKNIKGLLLITSGFKETGEEGAILEKKVVAEAQKAGILILGPNTMGITNPHINLFCTGSKVEPLPGSTALVCQSGNLGTQLLAFAEQQEIGIRAFSGSGNEAMVTIEDYMETFEVDELTKTVVLYIESIKQGRRFFESTSRVSKQKPVIVLNGGRTEEGSKAASSHTGAMASDSKLFSAALKQAGVIEVNQPMDLLDLSAVFSSLPLPKGNRVAIMTLGGGWGVVATDLCVENGLLVPKLSNSIKTKLDSILPPFWSHANPVDIVGERDPEIGLKTSEELIKWDGCDALIHLGIQGQGILGHKMLEGLSKLDTSYSKNDIEAIHTLISEMEKQYIDHIINLSEKYEKPIIGVSLLVDDESKTLYRRKSKKYKGVFFPTPERAVKALSGMCKYKEWLDRAE